MLIRKFGKLHRAGTQCRSDSARLIHAVLQGAAIFLTIVTGPVNAADTASCNKVILTSNPDYPPYSWYENNELKGSAIKIVALTLTRIHLPYEIRHVGSFQKVLAAAKEGRVDLIAELKNTPERREYLAFSEVPLFPNPAAVFIRADKKLAYSSWEDLIGLRGGITAGNKFGGGLDEFMASRLTIESSSRIGENFTKLAAGRIDYFINSYYPALSYLIREGRESDFKVLQPFATASDNFVGWSKASHCIGKLREFDNTLAAMVRSGEVRRILETSLDRLRRRPVPDLIR